MTGLLHSYKQASSLVGHQTNRKTNRFYFFISNSRCKSDYACICMVVKGKACSVPLCIYGASLYHINNWYVSFTFSFSTLSEKQTFRKEEKQ